MTALPPDAPEQYGLPTANPSAQNPTLIPDFNPLLNFGDGSTAFVSNDQFLSLYPRQSASATVTFTGSVTAGDTCSVELVNGLLPGGRLKLATLAISGDTLTTIAERLLDSANSNLVLQNLGVEAQLSLVSANPVLTFLWRGPVGNLTQLSAQSFVFTATATIGGSVTTTDITTVNFASAHFLPNAGQVALTGTATNGDVLSLTFYNPSLPNGQKTVTYTVASTLTVAAAAFVTAINADADLAKIGMTASSNLAVLSFVWTVGSTTVSCAATRSTTATLALAFVAPSAPSALAPSPTPSQTITVGGSTTTGEILTLTMIAGGISKITLNYTTISGDTTPTLLATSLQAAINANANFIAAGVTATRLGAVITLTWGTNIGLPGFTATVSATPSEVQTVTLPLTTIASSYVSAGGNTTTDVATGIKNAINANVVLAANGVIATSSAAVITLHWSDSLSLATITGGSNGTETVTIAVTSGKQTVTIGGTVTTGDQVSIKLTDPELPSPGYVIETYKTVGGDTTTTIATALKNLINSNVTLANAGITASSSTNVITVNTAGSDTIPTVTTWVNGQPIVTLTGTATTGDVINVKVTNANLGGGFHNVKYTVAVTDISLTVLAASVAAAINADSTLAAQNIGATSALGVVTLTYSATLGALTASSNANGTTTATVTGTATNAEQPVITVIDAALGGGQTVFTYTEVVPSDDNTAIAVGFKNLINADAGCIAAGITATNLTNVLSIKSVSVNQTTYTRTNSAHTTITLGAGPTETATESGAATETSTEADTSTGSEVLTPTTPMTGGSGPIIPFTNFQFQQGDSMLDYWRGKPYLVDYLTLMNLVSQGMPIK